MEDRTIKSPRECCFLECLNIFVPLSSPPFPTADQGPADQVHGHLLALSGLQRHPSGHDTGRGTAVRCHLLQAGGLVLDQRNLQRHQYC